MCVELGGWAVRQALSFVSGVLSLRFGLDGGCFGVTVALGLLCVGKFVFGLGWRCYGFVLGRACNYFFASVALRRLWVALGFLLIWVGLAMVCFGHGWVFFSAGLCLLLVGLDQFGVALGSGWICFGLVWVCFEICLGFLGLTWIRMGLGLARFGFHWCCFGMECGCVGLR